MPGYKRERLLRRGGQGEVWHGVDEHGCPVAIKRLSPSSDPAIHNARLARFRREVACQSTLLHEGIVEVTYSSLDEDIPYFVMPLAEGSLRDVLSLNVDGLDVDRAVEIFTEVVEAMAYAHSQQIIHRDLKPENILMYGSRPRVSDFGVGRRLAADSQQLTRAGFPVGSASYMPTEQLRDSHAVTPSADVFALGLIFYELLTGAPGIEGMDLDRVPSRFHYLLRVSTQEEPSQRFQSAVELLRELMVAAGGPIASEPGEELARLFNDVVQGRDRSGDMYRLLNEHSGDLDLFVNALTQAPASVVNCLAARPGEFEWLVRTVARHADGEFPSNAVDRIAYFLSSAVSATVSEGARLVALERLLVIAFQHERLYARDRFVDALAYCLQGSAMVQPVCAILRKHHETFPFVRHAVLELEPPLEVQAVFTQGAV
ncbi:serine/threonine-protein kinase [Leifsonia sp. 22587]|uniref:serine/threonine-protein kinase n=1 Tax=Leifsonia sp. 22587 TaxID=3453946 RepID=UPI003F85AC64